MANTRDSTAPPRRTRNRLIVAVVLGAVIVAAATWAYRVQRPAPDTTGNAAVSVQTTTVIKTDLSDSQLRPGTLGYGPPTVVKGRGQGIITRLPTVGATVNRGKPLYWVNDRPVPVFIGTTPLFRRLDRAGLTGSDVRLLRDNLAALGYRSSDSPDLGHTGVTAADGDRRPTLVGPTAHARATTTLTAGLITALRRWQRDVGLSPTGSLDIGQVAVLPGPARISALTAQPGDDVARDLLTVTEKRKLVTVPVAATEVNTIRVGAEVTVVLPSTRQIRARIQSISRVVDSNTHGDSTGDSREPQVNVLVLPNSTTDVADLDAAEVQVRFTTTTRSGVLAVPVSALVALREGGHAVQRPDGSLIAVTTGLFAEGLVQVSGTNLVEGLRVVTAA